jgi:hypothetical protein
MKRVPLYISIAFTAGLVTANTYNSVVDATNWCSDMPASIEYARNYFSMVSPGDFFQAACAGQS